MSGLGELFAFLTAFCCSASSLFFQHAGNKIGSLSVNIIRLGIAFVFISIYSLIRTSVLFPMHASPSSWMYLLSSGFIGFFLGDLFLFKSYTLIGARIAALIMASTPPLTALFGWFLLHERLHSSQLAGMSITIAGICLVILKKSSTGTEKVMLSQKRTLGIIYAFLGSIGQSLGLILSKLGLQNLDPFSATQIRILAAIPSFIIFITVIQAWPRIYSAFRNIPALGTVTAGAFFGPSVGVSLSLLSLRYTSAAISSTILSLVPVIIILPSWIIFKEKITAREIFGSVIAVIGIGILCIR